MRTEAEIAADALDRVPFSNGTAFEVWLAGNCLRSSGCVREALSETPNGEPCPLITVAIVERKTPKEWVDGDDVGDCPEFEEVVAHATDDEPLDMNPDALYERDGWRPVETIKGQEGLF